MLSEAANGCCQGKGKSSGTSKGKGTSKGAASSWFKLSLCIYQDPHMSDLLSVLTNAICKISHEGVKSPDSQCLVLVESTNYLFVPMTFASTRMNDVIVENQHPAHVAGISATVWNLGMV